MRGVRILILGLLVFVLVVVIGGFGAIAWVTGRALPQTNGGLVVPGLDGHVSVDRDINGIAQIRASTTHDLFLAQGYVHAQERMWQMEVWRHIASGRLSELFGEGTVKTDSFIRTMGWRRAAERDLAGVAPAARGVLEAYSQGVNAWLDANRDRLGLAFLATGASPEPWTPVDTLAWGKVQAWNLGGTWTARSSATWRTRNSATPRERMDCWHRGRSGRSSHRAAFPAAVGRARTSSPLTRAIPMTNRRSTRQPPR